MDRAAPRAIGYCAADKHNRNRRACNPSRKAPVAEPVCMRVDAAALGHKSSNGECRTRAALVGFAFGFVSLDVHSGLSPPKPVFAMADGSSARRHSRQPGLRHLRPVVYGIDSGQRTVLLRGAFLLLFFLPWGPRQAQARRKPSDLFLFDDFSGWRPRGRVCRPTRAAYFLRHLRVSSRPAADCSARRDGPLAARLARAGILGGGHGGDGLCAIEERASERKERHYCSAEFL